MDIDASTNDLDFSPIPTSPPIEMVASYIAETSIVRAITQGSGGPDNAEITDGGLRFVRHLLATSIAGTDLLPNLKNPDTIREVARAFIKRSGSAAAALQAMYCVMQP
jgi:hypothetical protein